MCSGSNFVYYANKRSGDIDCVFVYEPNKKKFVRGNNKLHYAFCLRQDIFALLKLYTHTH